MSVWRKALIVPGLFLSVVLLGGLRIGADIRFVPPPLIALVLGLLLIAALVGAGALQPARLVHRSRRPIENLSGAMVMLSLAGASVQVFTLLIPDRGLLHILFGTFFFVQLLSMIAGTRDRHALLRSLGVLLGSAFVLRYVVLESLYAAHGGTLTRVLTALMEGVSLGALQYEPNGAATGYTAFAAVVLYVVGVFLLQQRPPQPGALTLAGPPAVRMLTGLILIALAGAGCRGPAAAGPPAGATLVPVAVRDHALQRAQVWHAPAISVASAPLGQNPDSPRGFSDQEDVTCRFLLRPVGGTTPKFYCTLATGEVVKVKYGAGNAELHAEVAATRLLGALGFSVDRMFAVRRLRCVGCPAAPFMTLRCIARTGLERACAPGGLNDDHVREFDPAVIERRIPGRVIESAEDQGWAWFELDRIDAAAGGSARVDVDALRLVAVLLAHWDNKSENQRLVCPPGMDRPDGGCAAPVAVIQDLGATFGPAKLDLRNWRATPVWQEARACRVSMKQLPFGGGTFPERQISEEGRRRLLQLLEQLSDAQLSDLFTGSGATRFDAVSSEGRTAGAWVSAFRDKVRQIREAGPCPPAATLTADAGR